MRYKPDRKGTQEILNTPVMAKAMLSAAEHGANYARSISPRRTGTYARSFDVQPMTVLIGGKPRVAARLMNQAPYAAAVEWGRGGQRVLGRTLEELRLRYDPKGHR